MTTPVSFGTMVIICLFIAAASCSPNPDEAGSEKNEDAPYLKSKSTLVTPSSGRQIETGEEPTAVSIIGPAAVDVAEVLKSSNVFPKSNRITNTTNVLDATDKREGAISGAVIESSHPAGVTIKIYRSSAERNQARLRMVRDCPGCAAITECGPILIYEPYVEAKDMNKILSKGARERYGILKGHYKCE